MGRTLTDYDRDFFLWTQEQAALLREGAWSEVDILNLIEELESLGKRDRRALGSHLEGLVMHLLKWHYQPNGRQTDTSWYSTIVEHRSQIEALLEDSPSLHRAVAALLARRYSSARARTSGETRLALAAFPETCPWAVEQVLDPAFFPEAAG